MVFQEPVKLALWVGGICLLIALGCALVIVLANAGSRTLALAFGALFGSMIILGVQLWFELRPTSSTEDFGIEVIIDFQTNTIQTRHAGIYYRNFHPEFAANAVLVGHPITRDDAPKLARDLLLLSTLWGTWWKNSLVGNLISPSTLRNQESPNSGVP